MKTSVLIMIYLQIISHGNTAIFSWTEDSVTHKVTITKIGNNLQVYRESVSLDPKLIQNKQMDFISGTLTLDK